MPAADASGFIANFTDANTPGFQSQMTIAMMNYATTVATEPTTTTNHTTRVNLLTEMFKNQQEYVYWFCLFAVANGAIYGTTTDAQLLTLVGTIWTDLCTGANPLI